MDMMRGDDTGLAGKVIPDRFDGEAAASPARPGLFTVFLADVAALAGRLDTTILDRTETARAAAFARAEDRHRFEAGHVMVRVLLASYLGLDAASLPLYTEACPLCGGPHGRPAVAAEPRLHFSLSHGGGYALAAFSLVPIGVDVEPLPRHEVVDDLIGCLDEIERRELAALPERARPAAFARAWVRKEARLKALGTGLAVDPATIHAGTGGRPGPNTYDIAIPEGHAAAVHLAPVAQGEIK
jgi:4'-phosphopantetheinyl transferase